MTPVELSRTVLRAVRRAVDDGVLGVAVPGRIVVAPPGPGGCGDYATNVALQLARPAGHPPLRVAEILRPYLAGTDGITDVVVTGPGFINFRLRRTASAALVEEILRRGPRGYGFADGPTGQLVRLHAPHEVRAVVVMDVVARLLRSQGALVRASCEAPPEAAWSDVLGVEVDAHRNPGSPAPGTSGSPAPGASGSSGSPAPGAQGAPAPLDVDIRPVPVPASVDPLSLGRDAARWALLHPAAHDRPRITTDHLAQREGNPLFRVRYAHARTRALGRNAADLHFTAEPGPLGPEPAEPGPLGPQPAEPSPLGPQPAEPGPLGPQPVEPGPLGPQPVEPGPLGSPEEPHRAAPDAAPTPLSPTSLPTALTPTPLLTALSDHPRVLAQAAAHRAPDRLARHLVTVADAVLVFLPAVLPRGDEKPSAAHRARLALAEAAGTVLAGGLSLLGIDAPDHL